MPLFRRQVGKAIEQAGVDAEQVERRCFYLAVSESQVP